MAVFFEEPGISDIPQKLLVNVYLLVPSPFFLAILRVKILSFLTAAFRQKREARGVFLSKSKDSTDSDLGPGDLHLGKHHRKTIGIWRFGWENHRKTHRKMDVYPLVICYVAIENGQSK